jgi:hypothetical protein
MAWKPTSKQNQGDLTDKNDHSGVDMALLFLCFPYDSGTGIVA